MHHFWLAAIILTFTTVPDALACDTNASVCPVAVDGSFALIEDGRPAAVVWDAASDPAVRRAAASFASDLERVSGQAPLQTEDPSSLEGPAVVIGVLGQSQIIDLLVDAGKLDVGGLTGQWEAFRVAVVDNPWPNVPRALIIVGSDRRGAVFGTYDLSERIGVSPWYWFADVPARQQSDLFVTAGSRSAAPKVKYRGIFINDEDPAFRDWAHGRFGGINSKMYEHVFELILRSKGNYLWPAMWKPKAFHVDDPRNTVLADEMGLVMGTSHHEPMTRAHAEWDSNTMGPWDYSRNAPALRDFWQGGIERMMSKGDGQAYESLVTVGMRGDGDEPMSEETAIQLLETVVADQRQIIEAVTGKPAAETPQMWALYKEVQDYYDRGMTVPDDVTLLFADDNWGQVRRLPTSNINRPGGYGVYYHFDYVGGPRNYKWLNTIQIQKVWQQMNLSYARGARNLWVVNVGDLKPMEYPIDFFLKMAWDPEAMTPDALAAFPKKWAERTFGDEVAAEIGELMTTYSKYAARRKPELINEETYPLGEVTDESLDGGEFGRVMSGWRMLVDSMNDTKQKLDPDQHSAYFQLIEFPILALANLHELYYATAWNRRLASRYDRRTNFFIDPAEAAFERDAQLTQEYHALEDGKWTGMMNGVHMSYVIWNTPTQQSMPVLVRSEGLGEVDESDIVFAESETDPDVRVLEASAFDRSFPGKVLEWTAIPHLGQSSAAMVALPQGQPSTTVDDGVRLEYDFSVETGGRLNVTLRLNPTLDVTGSDGLQVGVSVDDGPVKPLTFALEPNTGGVFTPEKEAWQEAVRNNGHDVETDFDGIAAGDHTLKIWRLDDNVVLEQIVVRTP